MSDETEVEWIDKNSIKTSRCLACGSEITSYSILICLSCLDDEAEDFRKHSEELSEKEE